MNKFDELPIGAEFSLFSQSVDTHVVTAMADLRQISLILDEAVITLNNSFFSIHDGLEAYRDSCDDLVVDQVTPSMNKAVTALQFHDLTSQLLSRVVNRLDGLRDIVGYTQHLTSDKSENIAERLTRLDRRMLELSDVLHNKFSQSLNQQHMESGDVELF